MNDGINAYVKERDDPWSKLFYRVLWAQLPKLVGVKVLDFGSGLGITANHFAENNEVVAIEPDLDMAQNRQTTYNYEQIIGGIDELRNISSRSFDAVLCHNVLEYTTNPFDIVSEFCRLVKPGGLISIVKHNRLGRIMQKVIFENKVDEAMTLLHGGTTKARHFGRVNYYELSDLRAWMIDFDVQIEQVLGIRTFWGLPQDNEMKKQQSWQDNMFEIEMEVSGTESFTNVSFFQHVLINKGR